MIEKKSKCSVDNNKISINKVINFNNLPCDIKKKIYNINRDEDKHNKLLKRCLNEIVNINFNIIQYMDWVVDCVGISVWVHKDDYEYWINLEYNRDKKHRLYYMKKEKLALSIIKNLII